MEDERFVVESAAIQSASRALHALTAEIAKAVYDAMQELQLTELEEDYATTVLPLLRRLEALSADSDAVEALAADEEGIRGLQSQFDQLATFITSVETRATDAADAAAQEAAAALSTLRDGAAQATPTAGDLDEVGKKVEKAERFGIIRGKLRDFKKLSEEVKPVVDIFKWGRITDVIPGPKDAWDKLRKHVEEHGWDDKAGELLEKAKEALDTIGDFA